MPDIYFTSSEIDEIDLNIIFQDATFYHLPMNIDAKKELTRDTLSVLEYCSGRSLAILEIWFPVNLSYAEDPEKEK